MIGGIDLGGTKIEARLFDRSGAPHGAPRRVPTPRESLDDLVTALAGQVAWLDAEAGGPVPVGLATPGAIDPASGILFAANLVASGHPLGRVLSDRVGRPVAVLNDGMAFTLSEAQGGAGTGRVCLGIVIGTGLGGGVAIDGKAPPRALGRGAEIGHAGLPARALLRHGLPLLPCGCGALGCAEVYLSGPGIARLAQHVTGTPHAADALGDHAEAVVTLWADLAAEALSAAILTLDPEVIVLGGGVSRLPGLHAALADGLARHALGCATPPALRLAAFGDASGARGAALAAC